MNSTDDVDKLNLVASAWPANSFICAAPSQPWQTSTSKAQLWELYINLIRTQASISMTYCDARQMAKVTSSGKAHQTIWWGF